MYVVVFAIPTTARVYSSKAHVHLQGVFTDKVEMPIATAIKPRPSNHHKDWRRANA